jgi:hypothetical protein
MGKPAEVLPSMLRWAAPGALLILPGSQMGPEVPEIKEVIPERTHVYEVPGRTTARSLWIARRSCGT